MMDYFNEKLPGDTEIDTGPDHDTHVWETGIRDPRYCRSWIIVEQYKNRDAAELGHNRWVQAMKDPPDVLADVFSWESFAKGEAE